jgi:hypothetical protein
MLLCYALEIPFYRDSYTEVKDITKDPTCRSFMMYHLNVVEMTHYADKPVVYLND